MASDLLRRWGYFLLLTSVILLLIVVATKYQPPEIYQPKTGIHTYSTRFTQDIGTLSAMALLLTLMLTIRKWATVFGAAASLMMLLSACGWIIQILRTDVAGAEHSDPAIKALAALGCMVIALTGMTLRLAKVTLHLDLNTHNKQDQNVEPQSVTQSATITNPDQVVSRTLHIPTHTTQSQDTYHSLDEMPPEIRRQFEKILKEHRENGGTFPHTHSETRYSVLHSNDTYEVTNEITGEKRVYKNKEDLPSDLRKMFDDMF